LVTAALEPVFVWTGGALFVASLAFLTYCYLVVWSQPAAFDIRSWTAIAVNALLVTAFAVHHSLFAREPVKAWVSRAIPARLIRSIYVWIASVLLVLVCLLWRPVGGALYAATGWRAAVHASVQVAGLWIIARSARAIDPLELAGIHQPSQREGLQIRGPYGWVRHPLYLGWLLATFGAARMSGDRLMFAVITAIYLAVAVRWEERSLSRAFGERYEEYKRQVRWRMVPYVY
jgi:protein-S-isoprenylcysteine O-methyltransferase Ste14